jgi:hypothetical protein
LVSGGIIHKWGNKYNAFYPVTTARRQKFYMDGQDRQDEEIVFSQRRKERKDSNTDEQERVLTTKLPASLEGYAGRSAKETKRRRQIFPLMP